MQKDLPPRHPLPGRLAALLLAAAVSLVGVASAGSAPLAPAAPQQAAAQAVADTATAAGEPLALDDYPRWNRIASVELSDDGAWMTYAYEPLEGDGSLYVRELDGDAVHEVARGTDPEFSDDSRWLAYMIELPEEEQEELRDDREPVTRRAGLMDLASGETWTYPDADRFEFAPGSGTFVVKRRGEQEAEHRGTDLTIRDLSTGTVQNVGNVAELAFDADGRRLAWTVDAAGSTGNGIYVMELEDRRLLPLDTGDEAYERLTWNDDGSALAALRGTEPEGMARRANVLLSFSGLGAGAATGNGGSGPAAVGGEDGTRASAGGGMTAGDIDRFVYDPATDASFPDGMVLSELSDLEWTDDGRRIFLGVKEQREEEEDDDDDEESADVDVWHWRDERVQSVQMVRADRDRRSTWTSVVHLDDGRFVKLADEAMPDVDPVGDGSVAIGRLDEPYRYEVSWGGGKADTYRIDTATGERRLLVEALGRPMGASPDGHWYLYLEDQRLKAMAIDSGEVLDLTEISGVDFVDHADDHPYEKPTYGVAGWAADGSAVLVNHRFDIWSLPLDGGEAVNLTRGVGEERQIRFRHVDPERGGGFGRFGGGGDDEGIDLGEPLLLSAYGEWTKMSGYWTLEPGAAPRPLVWEDRSVSSLRKAEDADRVLFTRETFVEFPDWWVADADFSTPRKVTDANPQQAEYAWSPGRVLVDYEDDRGNKLQATLGLPAGYQEGERYPMLVYFYEKMSQRHHQYDAPRYDDRPHLSTYASNGYLVLQPDVVYTEGRPGESALDDVGSAVREAIELGYADPERICVQGHSWGGYQTSYLVTATDLFACVVTGAPVTNLVSFYNELYKSSGNPQQGITEVGQVRMGTSPWEDWELYLSQSPVHRVRQITTPFLILHGTEDGAVDWHQGLELYNAARRWGKEVILLSYPGEGHHLGRKENQIDFQIRMRQFFDHHMKGTPAPPWMTDGVPFLEKATGLRREEGGLLRAAR